MASFGLVLSVIAYVCTVTAVQGTICYNCGNTWGGGDQSDQGDQSCTNLQYCQSNEACMVQTSSVGGSTQPKYSCFSKAVCKLLMTQAFQDLDTCYGQTGNSNLCGNMAVGKRQLTLCSACCDDDYCNGDDCDQLKACDKL